MTGDKLDWIFDESASLAPKYDEWASTYDTDHDQWGWRGPDVVASAVLERLGTAARNDTIIDAGCGTGKAGIALRAAGWTGRIVGLDLSQGMLDQALATGVYDDVACCSLTDVPLGAASAAAVVSSGVFTHGHVGGEAFGELCRITRTDGFVAITQRVDLADAFAPFSDALVEANEWVELNRTAPTNLHTGRGDDVRQSVITWQVR